MTRKEQKELKLKLEQEFIDSIKNKKITGIDKGKFRNTVTWKEFRNKFKGKLDPVTLRKLPKRWQLHHMDLSPYNYTNLSMKNFEGLSPQVHDVLHWLYGYYRKDKNIIKRLKKLLDRMVEINDGKDVKDYK